MIVACILNLKTKQVAFTLDFVQAKSEPWHLIQIPKLFVMNVYVIDIKNFMAIEMLHSSFMNILRKGWLR